MTRARDVGDRGWRIPDIGSGDALKRVVTGADPSGYSLDILSSGGYLGGARIWGTYSTMSANGFLGFSTAENYDTHNIYDSSTNAYRLTVPAGITKVRVTAHISLLAVGTPVASPGTHFSTIILYKNSAPVTSGTPYVVRDSGGRFDTFWLDSGVIDVTPGDYFRLYFILNAGDPRTPYGQECYFSMDLLA